MARRHLIQGLGTACADVSAIVDTAHRLAQLYLDNADYPNARWAVQQVWAADPLRGDDGPWQCACSARPSNVNADFAATDKQCIRLSCPTPRRS
jgi:hypothetical protein